ncbi:hypothetical protein BO94DRAFT_599582 [Aspergillus sclerotioniger CBS 115572]|uniref:Nucleoside phosphorylase domain-containing protein n=1 Tax=Aspergillus sclerotioniger CBS 115572 TaxID=1450535 RepID=A0A317WDH6_9EURO|nr:hypothetical protein BO94DRAFT_599582 [Aspergillus sclerotioniger CBS 115572]PWY83108.1 hypothetical protein BO94DRAFT_599582 [Aspergillus sclerotioniger CBS 115572]
MYESLSPYVSDRTPTLVSSRIWPRIIVRGHQDVLICGANNEDTSFDRQRTTAKMIDSETLEICCFPGKDHVHHYALLIAYHLALNDIQQSSVIECNLPTKVDTMGVIEQSNLRSMGKVDTVVLGCVEDLVVPTDEQDQWETGTSTANRLFAWKLFRRREGGVVSFLTCLFRPWGDILDTVVRALRHLNDVSCVLYTGKAGSLRPDDIPNDMLVTGDISYVAGKRVTWDNVLEPAISAARTSKVCRGINVTVMSPLVETDAWLNEWNGRADWVDCEVGHAAEACHVSQMRFGYLNLISDNVA